MSPAPHICIKSKILPSCIPNEYGMSWVQALFITKD